VDDLIVILSPGRLISHRPDLSMQIRGKNYHTIWVKEGDQNTILTIDQRKLPFELEIFELKTVEDAYYAIKEMVVRGAPLIGITAAYGIYLALNNRNEESLYNYLADKGEYLKSSRPTAVNLSFAVDHILEYIQREKNNPDLLKRVLGKVNEMKEEEIRFGDQIGDSGVKVIEKIYREKGDTVNILTHCNAGWLACIDWGTATAPVYKAKLKGIPVHVWVDETRPRNQGARLTAFELGEENIPHTVIPDNTGGHLMQHGMVDLVIVGSDRTSATGDVANKIGTYLKALAAFDNHIPFYVALPSTSFDWKMEDGIQEIPIEQRDPGEVSEIEGWNGKELETLRLIPEKSTAVNYGFDVTPSRLITGLITERGICSASREGIRELFPEKTTL